jgi:hypothetical protein
MNTTYEERVYGPPVPLPTERFSDRPRPSAVKALRGVLDHAHKLEDEVREKARSIGAEAEVFGAARPGGDGYEVDRDALNDRVNAYLSAHPDASMTEAIASVESFSASAPMTTANGHEVRNVSHLPAPSAGARQAQSDALDRYLAADPGASMSEAIAAIERGES